MALGGMVFLDFQSNSELQSYGADFCTRGGVQPDLPSSTNPHDFHPDRPHRKKCTPRVKLSIVLSRLLRINVSPTRILESIEKAHSSQI